MGISSCRFCDFERGGRNCFWIIRDRVVCEKGLKKGDGNLEGQVIENAVQETVQETVDKVNSNWDRSRLTLTVIFRI